MLVLCLLLFQKDSAFKNWGEAMVRTGEDSFYLYDFYWMSRN